MAARVSARKGLCLAVHALGHLRASGYDAELHLAGSFKGIPGIEMRKAVQALHLDPYVFLHGIVHGMAAFYRMIDVFLCPSLREPFGSVCLEAAALGCVVVTTKVDGLVEAVQDNVTGHCIAPELPLEEYPRYGGTLAGLPEFVYNPETDTLDKLRILDPKTVAQVIGHLIDDPETFEQMSTAGIKRARDGFHFDRFVCALDEALEKVLRTV